MNDSPTMPRLSWVFLLLLGLIPLCALRVVMNNGLEGVLWSIFPLIGGVAIAYGLVTRPAKPGRAMARVVAGWLLVAIPWFFMFIVTVPLGVGLILVTRARRKSTAVPQGPRAA